MLAERGDGLQARTDPLHDCAHRSLPDPADDGGGAIP